MTNTMADLRQKVAHRLKDTLHGREVDTFEKGKPEIPHMLGIVTIGAISTTEAEAGTLLDPKHRFWKDYYRDINTENGVKDEIETAMHSLKEDGIFRVSTPYGDDAGIFYTEVDDVDKQSNEMMTVCTECEAAIPTEPQLKCNYGRYQLTFKIDCPECDFIMMLEQQMDARRVTDS